MPQTLRVAVLGTGHIARAGHLPALRALAAEGELEIAAAVDVDESAARAFAAEAALGTDNVIPLAFTDPAEMLAAVKPDLVCICSPPAVHREQAIAALRAGAWVWCEKPPCPTLADYDAIAAAEGQPGQSDHGGPYATYVFQQRFGSGARHVRQLIDSRALGSPVVAHCQTTWYRDATYFAVPWRGDWETVGGGTTMEHGSHQLDLLLALLGPWEQVQAMAAWPVPNVETETVATALIRFASGALATAVSSAVSADEVSRIRIDFDRGTIELKHLYGYRNADWRITPAPGVQAQDAAAWRDFGPDVPSSHDAQLRELVADIRAARRPRCSGSDGRAVLELITAIYKSAATGAPVHADEIGPDDPFYRTRPW